MLCKSRAICVIAVLTLKAVSLCDAKPYVAKQQFPDVERRAVFYERHVNAAQKTTLICASVRIAASVCVSRGVQTKVAPVESAASGYLTRQ